MARTQTASVQSQADREQEVRHAEQELGAAELQMLQEMARLDAAAGELERRIQGVRAAAAQSELAGIGDPQLADLKRRADGTQVPRPELGAQRDEALRARIEAVQVRRGALEQMRQILQAQTEQLAQLNAQIGADEAAITRWQAQAREDAARRQAQLAQQVPAPSAPRAPPPTPAAPPPISRPIPRRGQPRVRMQAAVDLSSESNFFTGFSTNISEGGLFVATVQSPPIGTEIDLAFSLPDGQKLSVQGVVRWTREVNDNTPDIFPGVGIQFVNLDPATANAIQRFVSSREPMFFPE